MDDEMRAFHAAEAEMPELCKAYDTFTAAVLDFQRSSLSSRMEQLQKAQAIVSLQHDLDRMASVA